MVLGFRRGYASVLGVRIAAAPEHLRLVTLQLC